MKNVFFYTLLLVILNSILIVNQELGLNVILFTLPLLVFLYYYLKLNKLIKNKKGLLFFIPIIILSTMYFIHDNIFNEFNIVIIPLLYVLMFIYTVSIPSQVMTLVKKVCFTFLKPVEYIEATFKSCSAYFDSKLKLSSSSKKKVKSILIIIPVIIIIIWLLCSADEVFAGLFSWIKDFSFANLINRIFIMIILYIYLNASLLVVLNNLKEKENTKNLKVEEFTMKVLTTILNITYLIFVIIQIKSLFLHSVASNINYAQYARNGFFQLMVISLINLIIVLLTKNSGKSKYNKTMSLIMVLLTFMIIVSAFYRMNLYEQAYGYTLLRLGVYVTLITEVILLIPTIFYIVKDKVNILNYYVIIITVVYTFINLFSVDVIIAKNNINRYNKKDDIDLEYLSNDYSDNIPILLEFNKVLKDEELKTDLETYLSDYYDNHRDKSNILEYNISKDKAIKLLSDNKNINRDYENTNKTFLKVILEDNSSTGYHWESHVSNKSIIDIDSETDYSNCPWGVAGCGGYRIYTIKSLRPGKTTVELNYVSHDKSIDTKVIYYIWVDDKYIIHETHEEKRLK